MLNNFELDEIAKNYGFDLTVLMKDELIDIKPKSGYYIINLESSSQGNGTHWLNLSIQNNNCFYQDSFGIICPIEIINFCKKIPKSHLAFSEMQMQNISTETCGWFAIGLLIHLNCTKKKDIYKSAEEYINQFSYDTTRNNKILQTYLTRKDLSCYLNYIARNDYLYLL